MRGYDRSDRSSVKYRPATVIGFFLFTWLMVGFFTGTLVLLGPIRWVTTWMRGAELGSTAENVVVAVIILAFVIGSALFTRWLSRRALGADARAPRVLVPGFATALAGVALWGWLNPGTWGEAQNVALETVQTESGAQFVFGPYPDEERLRELKAAGFTGVVSLLHPAVVPFEPKILSDEQENTEEIGMRLIHTPMLPWVGDNEASLAKIRELAMNEQGRYYVHCYLGRDRVNVVKRVLESAGVQVAGAADLKEARGFEERAEPFERGPLQRLEPGVWLVPYPNQHEMFGYLLFADIGHVALLLDPADAQQAAWIREAESLFAQYAVPYTLIPLEAGPQSAQSAARRVAALAKPVAVVVPFTETENGGDTAIADRFRAAWAGTQQTSGTRTTAPNAGIVTEGRE